MNFKIMMGLLVTSLLVACGTNASISNFTPSNATPTPSNTVPASLPQNSANKTSTKPSLTGTPTDTTSPQASPNSSVLAQASPDSQGDRSWRAVESALVKGKLYDNDLRDFLIGKGWRPAVTPEECKEGVGGGDPGKICDRRPEVEACSGGIRQCKMRFEHQESRAKLTVITILSPDGDLIKDWSINSPQNSSDKTSTEVTPDSRDNRSAWRAVEGVLSKDKLYGDLREFLITSGWRPAVTIEECIRGVGGGDPGKICDRRPEVEACSGGIRQCRMRFEHQESRVKLTVFTKAFPEGDKVTGWDIVSPKSN